MASIFQSEGFWVCIGALIGAAIGAIVTYITAKQTLKSELKKQKADYLMHVSSELKLALTETKRIEDLGILHIQVPEFLAFSAKYKSYVDKDILSQILTLELDIRKEMENREDGFLSVKANELLNLYVNELSTKLIKVNNNINKLFDL